MKTDVIYFAIAEDMESDLSSSGNSSYCGKFP